MSVNVVGKPRCDGLTMGLGKPGDNLSAKTNAWNGMKSQITFYLLTDGDTKALVLKVECAGREYQSLIVGLTWYRIVIG